MDSVVGQNLRVDGPVFLKGRGELHEVARNRRTRLRWIVHIGKEAMHRMAHLMKHGGYIIKTDQCRLPFRGGFVIQYVDNHRLFPEQIRLGYKGAHACASPLGAECEKVYRRE